MRILDCDPHVSAISRREVLQSLELVGGRVLSGIERGVGTTSFVDAHARFFSRELDPLQRRTHAMEVLRPEEKTRALSPAPWR